MFRGSRCCGSADGSGLSRKPPDGRGDGRRRSPTARLIRRHPSNWADGRRTNAGCEIASRLWLAIARYQAVTPGESSYATAQSELAMSLEAAGQHAEAVAAAHRALALQPFEPQTYNTLATAQEALKQIDDALATYAAGIRLFPYNQNLMYNLGVIQFQQNRPAEALASFQRSLELVPTHPNSHRLLAVLAAEQGQTSRALLGWLTYLVLANPGQTPHDVLVAAETLAEGAPVVEDKERIKPIAANEAFAELDQLIEGKVA